MAALWCIVSLKPGAKTPRMTPKQPKILLPPGDSAQNNYSYSVQYSVAAGVARWLERGHHAEARDQQAARWHNGYCVQCPRQESRRATRLWSALASRRTGVDWSVQEHTACAFKLQARIINMYVR
jgi:hypothetical protein